MDIQNSDKIIKTLLQNMDRGAGMPNAISANDIRQKIKTIDKSAVISKMNAMGLGAAANKLKYMSDEDIIREVSRNPSILKKLNSLLKN